MAILNVAIVNFKYTKNEKNTYLYSYTYNSILTTIALICNPCPQSILTDLKKENPVFINIRNGHGKNFRAIVVHIRAIEQLLIYRSISSILL